MGKTEAGAVFLDADKVSPFAYYQYWINVQDADVGRFLKLYTWLPLDRIAELEALQGARVREAVVGRTTSPFVAGIPTDEGGLQVVQVVTSATRMRTIPIATLPELTPGARIRVDNLDNGETRLGWMPQDGRFRLPFPADAPDPLEKAILAGIPESGYVEGAIYEIDDNVGLGDRFTITITDAEGTETVIDSFEADVLHEGITMRAGSPLVAGSSGLGHIRSSPRLHRDGAS